MLDAEMKVLHACTGEDYAGKAAKAERQAITEEEEKEMRRAGVLGESSPDTSLNTLYFYIGKLFYYQQYLLSLYVVPRRNVLNTYLKCCSRYGIKNTISRYNHYANKCIICLLFWKEF